MLGKSNQRIRLTEDDVALEVEFDRQDKLRKIEHETCLGPGRPSST